ncbi:MAG TPA: helix-turn-helix domain-containing protein, partial [Myxococcaceae bacterium]
WPGNVRELRNVVERVVHMGEEALPDMTPAVPAAGQAPSGGSAAALDLPFKEAKERLIEGFERDYLRGLLERCGGNQSLAAREAGIARLYLRKLLQKHGISARDSDD